MKLSTIYSLDIEGIVCMMASVKPLNTKYEF